MRQDLQTILEKVCPILSTRMVDLEDPTTWSYEPTEDATPSQIKAADKLLASITLENWNANEEIIERILTIEAQQTPRNMREAALGLDGGKLATINDEIVSLRSQLKKF